MFSGFKDHAKSALYRWVLTIRNNHTYRFQELCTDGFEMLTTIEVPLKGCHDQLWSYASLLTMHVVQHVDEVTQTKKSA